jgi:RNA polymerase sigma-70 factor (ECF subfamily)
MGRSFNLPADNVMSDDQSGDLLARWREGDEQAASELVRRYADQLIALTRSRLPKKVASRIDPEDVMQSVYRSFFAGAREGQYDLRQGGDLWRLLVSITLHKLYKRLRHNAADKRAVDREQRLGNHDVAAVEDHMRSQEPSPAEAAALADELEQVMRQLDPVQRRVFELRLQGYNLDEIAAETRYSQRTVCRILDLIKELLQRRHLGTP